MDVDVSETTTEVVTVEGYEFEKEKLVSCLSLLQTGGWAGKPHESRLKKLKSAGLVEDNTGPMSTTDTVKYRPTGDECNKLLDQLKEGYTKYRVKPERQRWGPFDESEDDWAEKDARAKLEELEERNPDVSFKLDEEELSQIK